MLDKEKIDNCSGCFACYNICSKECISMKEYTYGFRYPIIDEEKCSKCQLCNEMCGNNNKDKRNSKFEMYYGWSTDEKNRKNSSSGGIFGELAKYIIENNGIVFGAGFDKDLNIIHKSVTNLNDLEELKGSKYVQSNIGYSYKQVKQYLKEGKLVLFSGTPCQISGLYKYLGKENDNLYTVDIICHGVCSPKVWRKYLSYLEKQYKSKPVKVSFRDKTYGWRKYSVKVTFENGKEYIQNLSKDLFMQGFLENIYLRPSCYNCYHHEDKRKSDITLGDYWGFNNKYPDEFDDKGVSVIIANTEQGLSLLKQLNGIFLKEEKDKEYVIKNNPCLYYPSKKHKYSSQFFEELDTMPFNKLLRKYIKKVPFITKFKNTLIKIKHKLKGINKK